MDTTLNSSSVASSGNTLQLGLATVAFAICFAVFGSVSAMMPILKENLNLDPVQVSIALAIPVLLGSVGRIPLGILSDRYGGRVVFALVMAVSAVPAGLMGYVANYSQLIACGFFIGIALASFSVGTGFVSGWYPPAKQGMALGVYGAGNVGQSLAAFGSPVLAATLGVKWGFWTFGILLLVWLVVWVLAAENPPRRAPAKGFGQALEPLRDGNSWLLSLYYFLTFGGFVAMAVYLPIFLTEIFKLTPGDAGFRTAGFVLLATSMRPVGGLLADRIGGRKIPDLGFPGNGSDGSSYVGPLDGSLHNWGAEPGGCDRVGQWRCFQACTRVFPSISWCSDGPRRSGWRVRRFLPAAGARRDPAGNRYFYFRICVPRSLRNHLLCCSTKIRFKT